MSTPPTKSIAKPLASVKVDLAFPLIQLLASRLSLEQWRTYVRAMTDSTSPLQARKGIVVLEDASGYLFGLFSYVDGLELSHGPTLRVDNLVVPHLVDSGEAAGLMEREMRDIARRLDCRAIHVHLANLHGTKPSSALARFLNTAGYRDHGTIWCRTLPVVASRR